MAEPAGRCAGLGFTAADARRLIAGSSSPGLPGAPHGHTALVAATRRIGDLAVFPVGLGGLPMSLPGRPDELDAIGATIA